MKNSISNSLFHTASLILTLGISANAFCTSSLAAEGSSDKSAVSSKVLNERQGLKSKSIEEWEKLEAEADRLCSLNETDKSASIYLKSLELARTEKLPPIYQYRCLKNLGLLFLRLNKYEPAKKYLQNCLRLQDSLLGKDSQFADPILAALCQIEKQSGQKETELELQSRLFQLRKTSLDSRHPDYYFSAIRLVELSLQLEKWNLALDSLFTALPLRPPNHPEKAALLWDTGMVYEKLNELKQSEIYYKKCLNLSLSNVHINRSDFESLINRSGESLISLYLKQGRQQDADELKRLLLSRELQSKLEPGQKELPKAALEKAISKASAYEKACQAVNAHKPELAIASLEHLCKVLDHESKEDQVKLVFAFHYLGHYHYLKGNLQQATKYSLDSLALRKKLKLYDQAMTNNLETLGNIYLAGNKGAQAQEYYRQAVANEKRYPREKVNLAIDYFQLAATLIAQNKFKEAQAAFEQSALLVADSAANNSFKLQLYRSMADNALKLNEKEKALSALLKARELAPDDQNLADSIKSLQDK